MRFDFGYRNVEFFAWIIVLFFGIVFWGIREGFGSFGVLRGYCGLFSRDKNSYCVFGRWFFLVGGRGVVFDLD